MGVATTRYEERVLAAFGKGGQAAAKFEASEGVCGAGVLFMLPALLEQGLLTTKEVYQLPSKHYYSLESIVLTLAFMALARIKNPEQLKQCKPGEIGRIIGLDRIPEVRCLREKIKVLSGQNNAGKLNKLLIDQWYNHDQAQDGAFLYIDGHVRIYYGSKANLPAKYISRQKLCLSATTEFWVNDAQGMPVMMVLGELTEKLQKAIEDYIIPQLQQTTLLKPTETLESDQPQCTFIFDREAYEPAFFGRLWQQYRIAVITYRKNVKDYWNINEFKPIESQVLNNNVTMHLCEKKVELGGYLFREIRKLDGSHQTAIITTHPSLDIAQVAIRMFARWIQENFFRYLIIDYDFDKMIEFGVETIDADKEVVNPDYRKINQQLKKVREKIKRVEAKFYPLVEQAMDQDLDQIPEITQKQAEYLQNLNQLREQETRLLERREQTLPRVKLKDMPEMSRYNKLKTESKILMNVIKMICYRAESAVASISSPFLGKAADESRMFIKQVIKNHADLIPDYENQTLTVNLHGLSAPRFNYAASKLAELLNETETVFPGTNLRMIFKITAHSFCEK